jgi:SAM-dependent methyltransferase
VSRLREISLTSRQSSDLSFQVDCIDPFDRSNDNLWIKLEHLGRYLFAADYLRSPRLDCVADIACGSGYGLTELGTIADRLIGIDQSAEILNDAAQAQGSVKPTLLTHDLDHDAWFTSLEPGSVDAIVSFETLEHLVDPTRAIAKFSRLLKPRGICICSVPNVLHEPRGASGLPTNASHKQLFSGRSLRHLLEQHGFQIEYQLGQACANLLFKRESQLLKHKSLKQRLGNYSALHDPAVVRHLSYLLAYPTVEDIDGSYSLIVVAQKC